MAEGGAQDSSSTALATAPRFGSLVRLRHDRHVLQRSLAVVAVRVAALIDMRDPEMFGDACRTGTYLAYRRRLGPVPAAAQDVGRRPIHTLGASL